MSSNEQDARHLAESLARASYGRLVAIIAARSGDIAAAEDALSEAFERALQHWPRSGVPDNPEAWLVVTARRSIGHIERHQKVRDQAGGTIEMLYNDLNPKTTEGLPDERLKPLFVCAHPAIAPGMRTPLMLQTVLGITADRIGKTFLVPGQTMGQRLVRAKSKIKDARISFDLPTQSDLPDRLQDVLNAIYAAFNTGWDDLLNPAEPAEDLAEEAIYLARLVVDLLPDQVEAYGLLSLMLNCEARRAARRAQDGRFIPLSSQDPALWNRNLVIAAEHYLQKASAYGQPGRYQTEAAIQSVHAGRLFDLDPSPQVLVHLYQILVRQTGSVGAAVSLAAAHLAAADYKAADRQLATIDSELATDYQPYWVTKARLFADTKQIKAAENAYARAIEITADPNVADYLASERSRLVKQRM